MQGFLYFGGTIINLTFIFQIGKPHICFCKGRSTPIKAVITSLLVPAILPVSTMAPATQESSKNVSGARSMALQVKLVFVTLGSHISTLAGVLAVTLLT